MSKIQNEFISLSEIETKLNYKTKEAKVQALAAKAALNNIDVFILRKDYEANNKTFFNRSSHPLYEPKHTYNGMTIKQYLKATDSPLSYSIVLQRIYRGWSLDEAFNTPKGSWRPAYEQHRKRNQTGVCHKKAMVIKTNVNIASDNGKTTTLKDLYGQMKGDE